MSRREAVVMVFGVVLSVIVVFFASSPIDAQVVCFKCHKQANFEKAKVVHAPVKTHACDKCHSPHVARYKGLLQKRPQELCYSCHGDKRVSFNKNIVHKPVSDGNCLACHAPHNSQWKGLLKNNVTTMCAKCHKDVAKKAQYVHSPFKKGQCLLCHEVHNADRGNLLKLPPERLCFKCHKKGDLIKAHKDYPGELKGCLSCHSPHASNRKWLIRNFLHAPYEKGCTECHKKGGEGPEVETCFKCHHTIEAEMNKTHSHFTNRISISCIECHYPHAGDDKKLLKGKEYQFCRSCHSGTYERYKESPSKHPDIEKCTGCHEPHGSKHLAMLRGNGTDMCIRCHESQGKFTHPIGEDILDKRTGQMVTCVTCHNPMGTEYKFQLVREGKKDLCILCHRAY